MGYAIVGIVLDGILQGFSGIVGMAIANLDLAAIDQSLRVVGVAFYFGVSLSSLLVQGVLGLGLPVPLSVST